MINHYKVGADLEPQLAQGAYSVATITASTTLDIDDSGKTILIGTDALVVTLPLIGESTFPVGSKLRFVNIGADGNNIITLSPNALDGINGTIANAAADSVASGVVDKDLVNTKASANKGDYVELTAYAETAWYITAGVGIWASEG